MENSPQNKMGTKPILPLLISMSLPVMLSMLIQSMYNIVDSIFVSRISENALTAVSLAFPIQNFILAVAVGTGVGINSLISRRLGEKKNSEANNVANHGFIISIFTSIIFAILGILFVKMFFTMFTDSSDVIALGCSYTYIVTILSFGIIIHIAVEKILQATGNMLLPMLFQLTGAVINIILDPILIFGLFGFPKMGITGAAIATVVGQVSAMVLALIVLFKKKHEVNVNIKGFKFDFKVAKSIYQVGLPAILMQSIGSILVICLNGILIAFSQTAVSVLGIYFKLQSFIFMPIFGLNQGAMPIMGYNYGAKNRKRLISTLKSSLVIAILIMVIGMLLFILLPEQLLSLFESSSEMIEIGTVALRVISLSFFGAAISIILSTFFQAIGKGSYSLIISMLRQLILILPLSFIFANTIGLNAVWFAFPISEIVSTFLSLFLFAKLYKNKIKKGM